MGSYGSYGGSVPVLMDVNGTDNGTTCTYLSFIYHQYPSIVHTTVAQTWPNTVISPQFWHRVSATWQQARDLRRHRGG